MTFIPPTEFAEDAQHTSGDKGVQMLAVRKDTAAALGADGDYTPLESDSSGRLHVNVGTSALPTGAATLAEQQTQTTSLQLIDDAIVADDAAFTPATTKVMMAGFEFDDTSPDSVNEGDAGAARMSANRNIYVNIRDNAGNERGLNIDANGEMQISGIRNAITVSSHAVTNAGTFVVQENGSALTALQLIDDIVYTDDTSTHSTGTSKGALFMAAATPTDASVNANDIGAVAMTTDRKLHVSVQDALPAGTNAIGKLAANSGVDIGDVDVTSIIPGTGATNLGKARDSAIGATDTGVAILGVRRDTPTAETPAAGDYIVPQYSANGEAWVRLAGELADDAAFTPGTTRVVPVGYTADESSTDSVDEGDIGAARMTLDRKQIVTPYVHSQGGWSVATGSIGATKTDIGTANTAGTVGGWYFYNSNASVAYVQFFNAQASAVTLGTTAPVYSIGIPATSGANIMSPVGIQHSTAICIAITTTRAGSTGPGSTVDYNIFYKQ